MNPEREILRNKFALHYPEEAQTQLDRLNLVMDASDYVTATFNERFAKLQDTIGSAMRRCSHPNPQPINPNNHTRITRHTGDQTCKPPYK